MALYHKWGVKTGFTCALEMFMLISDSLGGVAACVHFTKVLVFFQDLKIDIATSSVDIWPA